MYDALAAAPGGWRGFRPFKVEARRDAGEINNTGTVTGNDPSGSPVTDDSELIVPVALEVGGRFAIREGGRTVGAGVITKIIE